ncbi:uncharacterized protein METZ01_LOCUS279656, partial [marine metagenome]
MNKTEFFIGQLSLAFKVIFYPVVLI